MNSPLVSICVPIYNVASYIEQCVRSLMEQTYDNIEYVFVNDCSTDSSETILQSIIEQYPHRLPYVRIIHNDHNHGLAYTRRVSIEYAQGEYVCCVDSDDYVDINIVQHLVNKAMVTDADIVVAGYYYKKGNTTQIFEPYPYENETDYLLLGLSDLLNSMCFKLFLRSLFTEGRSCFAPEGMDFMEDRMTCLFLSSKARHIVSLNEPLYYYIYRNNSISNGITDKHFRCLIRFWQEVDKLLEEMALTEKYKQIVGMQKVENKAVLMMYCNNYTRKQFADLYAEEERMFASNLSRGLALMHWLTKHHFWVLTYCYQRYIRWLDNKKHY